MLSSISWSSSICKLSSSVNVISGSITRKNLLGPRSGVAVALFSWKCLAILNALAKPGVMGGGRRPRFGPGVSNSGLRHTRK